MSGNQCKVRTNRLPNVEQLWMFPMLDNVIGIFVPYISHVINQGGCRGSCPFAGDIHPSARIV